MERELEKTLLEIECSIKDHERRGNTHTQSVLEQARDIMGMCAQAARTPSDLKEILERDTAKAPVDIDDEFDMYVCPNCNMAIGTIGDKRNHHFCLNCGQKLRWEVEI